MIRTEDRNPASLKLRLATENDKTIVLEFVRQYHDYDNVPFDETITKSALKPLLGHTDAGRIWLIDLDGSTVGYIALCFGYSIEFGGCDAFVEEIYLLKEHRGKGAGRAVLEDVLSKARKLGVKALHLEVDRRNERARHLYSSLGFSLRERYHLMSLVL